MDEIDIAIMRRLREDARTPFLSIAKEIGVSEGTIRNRVRALIRGDIITKFTIETRQDVSAFVGVQTMTKTHTKDIVQHIRDAGAWEIYEVAGRFDIIAKIPGDTLEAVNAILDKIRGIGGVVNTETFTVLAKNS